MYPTLGRIVHFMAPDDCGGETYAGIIVATYANGLRPGGVEDKVDLVTFGPSSFYHNNGVPFAEKPTPGCWSWPPRVPEATAERSPVDELEDQVRELKRQVAYKESEFMRVFREREEQRAVVRLVHDRLALAMPGDTSRSLGELMHQVEERSDADAAALRRGGVASPASEALEQLRLAGISEDVVTFLRDWHKADVASRATHGRMSLDEQESADVHASHVCSALARCAPLVALLEQQGQGEAATPAPTPEGT